MKAKPFQLEALKEQIKNKYAGALVFGTDFSRIQELSQKIKQFILPKADAFSLVLPSANQLKQTPFLATDEANTPNLMGERRLIWIKDVPNLSDEILQHFCDNRQTDAFLLITCDNLPKNNSLRIEAESNPQIITFACYPPDENELIVFVKDFLHQSGFQMTADAISYLIHNTSGNLSILNSELNKIALYNIEKKSITLPVIQNLIGTGDVQIDLFIQLIADKKISEAISLISTLQQQGEQFVSVIRSLNRYFDILLSGKNMLIQGDNPSFIVDKLLKPAQFRLKQPLQRQLTLWSMPQLIHAHHSFLESEIQMKISTLSQELILEKCLLNLNLV